MFLFCFTEIITDSVSVFNSSFLPFIFILIFISPSNTEKRRKFKIEFLCSILLKFSFSISFISSFNIVAASFSMIFFMFSTLFNSSLFFSSFSFSPSIITFTTTSFSASLFSPSNSSSNSFISFSNFSNSNFAAAFLSAKNSFP